MESYESLYHILAAFRLSGTIFSLSYYRKYSNVRFLFMIIGWFFWGLAPLFHNYSTTKTFFSILYGLFIILGSYLIAFSIILEFHFIKPKFIIYGMIILFILFLISFFFLQIQSFFTLVVIFQFLFIQMIFIFGLTNLKKIKKIGGIYSLIWLFLLIITGVIQTYMLITVPSFKNTQFSFGINYLIVYFISFFIMTVEQKIAEQKIVVVQNQLIHSQKMDALGRLAGGIAHDFNNYLSVINGLSSLILQTEENLNTQTMENLKDILDSGVRAEKLTKKILTFSRKHENQQEKIELNSIINNLEQIIKRITVDEIQLKINYFKNKLNINGDPTQIEQIILNLVVNSVDAMPKGGELLIETDYVEIDMENKRSKYDVMIAVKSGQYGLISIKDNGIGMNKEVIPRIFEPFFTTKAVDKGTGLGLSIIYGIVKELKGTLSVSSEPEKGTIFNIFLPLVND